MLWKWFSYNPVIRTHCSYLRNGTKYNNHKRWNGHCSSTCPLADQCDCCTWREDQPAAHHIQRINHVYTTMYRHCTSQAGNSPSCGSFFGSN
uniref:Uncharacterized protein n=1 Tax=Arundo donax TaxID=35708 RepID=A0A0A9G6E8_ARUDO